MAQLFGKDMHGLQMQLQAKKIYVTPNGERKRASWFLSDGRPRFTRHWLNKDRECRRVEDHYSLLLDAKGLVEAVGGIPVGVPIPEPGKPLEDTIKIQHNTLVRNARAMASADVRACACMRA